MPEVSSDERGRRVFQIHKEKAAENAMEKIRKSLGRDWEVFNSTDLKALKYILEETWVSLERDSWEKCAFSRLKKSQLESIIEIGKLVKKMEIREDSGVEMVSRILVTLV